MSTTPDYESAARQNYRPATTNENVYEHVYDHKLADMSLQSVRTPVLRAVPLSPPEGDPEPDSTNPESIIHSVNKVDREVEYHIAEKIDTDNNMSVDTTLAGLVRIEEAIDNVGHITYPILHTDDSNDDYMEECSTLIQSPINTAIVQNVTKLPQNFTINVDATVGNITSIQNIQDVSGTQTLWLPTILATSAPTSDPKADDDRSQAGVSQIIITSESYVNETNNSGRRSNMAETNFINRPKTSKVQILSNIAIPKTPTYSQYATGKEVTPVYGTHSHIYKLSNSVLSKSQKSQSLIGCSNLSPNIINNNPIKSVPYNPTFSKSTNLNKTLNKINNGANLNAMVAASSSNTQCHILSRVVSGPNKMSVHSGRKSGNTLKGSKSSSQVSNKNQSRPIKIIQQTGSSNKSEGKTWPVATVTYKNQQSNFVPVDSSASKVIQKVGSPTNKGQPMPLTKFPSKGERLVLQSPCGPVLLSTAPISTSLNKTPHYVQSGSTPNLRYVQTYGSTDHQISTISQVSANQQLTAQILQSLSQPKLMLQQSPTPINHNVLSLSHTPPLAPDEPPYPKRIVVGDKSTLLTEDDIIGVEERPNLSEELRRYSFQSLAFIMLDHTYAQPAQKQPAPSTPTTPISTAPSPIIASPPITTSPSSPLKRTSPVIMSPISYEMPLTVPTSIIGTPRPLTPASIQSITYIPQAPPPPDDDAASVISSIDGDKRRDQEGGSDTETAPEGEEEGKTRCICDFTHDDGYMICCDRCGEWQHVDCMGIDRQNIPDAYMCELCLPRQIDRRHARVIQLRKREELSALGASDSDSSDGLRAPGQRRKRLLTVTTYTNTTGSCVTTYNSSLPVLPPLPQPSLTIPKRGGPKRQKKPEVVRKNGKRKLAEKRVKRKKELLVTRNKYGPGLSNQSHFQESYELAVTNHYSPELRAKIMKYSNKLGNSPNMAYAMNAHLCTTVPHAGGKILIATKDLKENTPIIELRGKYMLSNQHRPQPQNSARAGSQKPGPFVFFYRLPKDNTQICIDTRTYGNEARFARRSCKPNAELQHCIVKGALHVYLVTTGVVQSDTEITVGHDSDGSKQPCACGNPKHCKVNGLNTLPPRKSIDYPPREKRSRNRCLSTSSAISPPLTPTTTTPVKEFTPLLLSLKSEKSPPQIKHEFSPLSPAKSAVVALNFDEPPKIEAVEDIKSEIDLIAKEEMKPEDIDEPDFSIVEPVEEKFQDIKQEIPLPPSPLPINDQSEPKEIVAKEEEKEIKQENEIIFSDEEKQDKFEEKLKEIKELKDLKELKKELKELKEPEIEEDNRRMTRDLTAKSACHDRSSRSSRTTCVNQDSLDDKTDDSQDKLPTPNKEKDKRKMTREERKMEAIMKAIERMEKAEQRKQEVKERQKRRESDPHPNVNDKDEEDEIQNTTKKRKKRKGRARTTSQSNRRRLNSADSDMVTSGDEAPSSAQTPPRSLPPVRRDSAIPPPDNDLNDGVNEELGLSSACLLVEAAVGSVESAFKLPKTKKTMATEWIGRSPERTPSPYRSPYRPALVSAPSLESLVRVASTMIGDLSGSQDIDHEEDTRSSPPRTPGRDRNRPPKKARRITRSTPPAEVAEVVQPIIPQHSAKKRWLRQAISEESDSPSAESPPNEMVTPLKKRRLARESLSCDQNLIVPCNEETSPILTSEDSPVKDDVLSVTRQYKVRNIMDSIYGRDRTRSDSGQGSDDPCNIDNEMLQMNIKGPHDSENIRRIIGVPTPEEELPPEISRSDDIRSNNNNNVDLDETNYNKAVPMEIDNTVPAQPKIQECVDVSNIDQKGIESPNEKLNSCQSADTSGNSSPQRDEMDDIQKKIHSFHTENIQILKSRNKKPPKEKRKKVNLNFDLNMVDDQISIQLRTEDTNTSKEEVNGDLHEDMTNCVHNDLKLHVSPENIPLPPVEPMPLLDPENIPLPEEPSPMSIVLPPETIPLPEEPMKPVRQLRPTSPFVEKHETTFTKDRPSVLENSPIPFSSRFSSTGLFSGIFSNMSQSFNMDNSINENVPNMSIIKSAIDRTTNLDNSLFEKDCTPADDFKSVQAILTRVNNMDSNNSVILSGVLNSSNKAGLLSSSPKPVSKPYFTRTNDPRLNPPPAEKPKPVRRKLSISEYRKRHKCVSSEEGRGEGVEGAEAGGGVEWSSESSGAGSLSPQRLDAAAAAAADELEQRLHRELNAEHMPKGVFDAQPTALERQRENLSSRLRREFGLALPDDEESRPPTDTTDGVSGTKRCDRYKCT